jgi:uncharacterized membrane protein
MRPISLRQRRWIETESQSWIGSGFMEPNQAQAVLDSYESTQAILARRGQRALFALLGIAVLMCATGLLLLIGYNWNQFPRAGKVSVIFGALALAFAGSAWAYARGRAVLGEIVAFAATLIYGNAIWLLAQVFHISGRYPDGVFWWMAGALLAACLLGSSVIGIQALLLLATWTGMETFGFSNANYWFLPFAAAAFWLAHRLDSRLLAFLTVLAIDLWLLVTASWAWSTRENTLVLVTLLGCACYAAGTVRWGSIRFASAMAATGLATSAVSALLLTVTAYWDQSYYSATWPALITACVLLAITTGAMFAQRPPRLGSQVGPQAEFVLFGFSAVLAAWLIADGLFPGWGHRWATTRGIVVFFTTMAAVFAVWLLARGVRSESGRSFAGGAVMLVLLVLIRWIDLIGNMVASALLLFAGAAVVVGTAYFWRRHQLSQDVEVRHA